MKPITVKSIRHFVFILFFSLVGGSSAFAGFKHPGIYSTIEQMDFVKEKVELGEEPWKSAYDELLASNPTTREPHAFVKVPGSNDPKERGDMDQFCWDASYTYTSALLFYFTGEQKYADHAIKMLNAWNIFEDIAMDLYATWGVPHFMNAAELMKHLPGTGWKEEDIKKFSDMAGKYMWERTDMPPTNAGSNQGCTAVESQIAIAIFLDDQEKFNEAVADINWLMPKWIWLNDPRDHIYDGETANTCRDLNHTKLTIGLIYASHAAWNQGLDLFSKWLPRWTAFAEFHAGIMTGDTPVPADICSRNTDQAGILWCKGNVSWADVTLQDSPPCNEACWEVLSNHIGRRLGASVPITLKMTERNRPLGAINYRSEKWETLLHADINPADYANTTPFSPAVKLTSPEDKRAYRPGTKVFFIAEASDMDGSIANVIFCVNGETVAEVKSSPYSTSWTPTEPGNYTIYAVAFDNDSLSTVSDSVVVEISNDALPVLVVESVDEEDGVNFASNLFDGLKDDDHRWSALGYPKTVVLDYGESKMIEGTKVWMYKGRSYHYTIELSNSPIDGFVEVVNQKGAISDTPSAHSFAPTSARYLRFTVTGATGYKGTWTSINELEIVETNEASILDFNASQSTISIYPNPVNNMLNIDFLAGEYMSTQILIYDVSGNLILTKELTDKLSQVDISELNRGFYVLNVDLGGEMVYTRFIKE